MTTPTDYAAITAENTVALAALNTAFERRRTAAEALRLAEAAAQEAVNAKRQALIEAEDAVSVCRERVRTARTIAAAIA